mgnify:CR=1 FL=1
MLLIVCDEIDRINRDIYSLLNLVILLLVVPVGWPCDIVLARTLLAADHWLFIATAVVIVVVVILLLLLVRPFLLLIVVVPIFFVLRRLLIRLVVVLRLRRWYPFHEPGIIEVWA